MPTLGMGRGQTLSQITAENCQKPIPLFYTHFALNLTAFPAGSQAPGTASTSEMGNLRLSLSVLLLITLRMGS